MQQGQRTNVEMITDTLYERYAAPLLRYLYRHTRSRQDAEDILVDTFLAALEEYDFDQLSDNSQKAWLWRVARNKLVDSFRRSARQRSIPLEQIAETLFAEAIHEPEQAALRMDDASLVKRLLAQLPPSQQEVIWLRFSYDLRCAEIASILGKREAAVRVMLSRALNSLRQNLLNAREGGSYDE